jgi:hypothetical protein
MARERSTSLCTKPTTGTCKLCDVLDERDAFLTAFRAWLTWPFVRVWSWIVDLWSFVDSSKGYQAVVPALVTLIGAYFGLYAIVEARHERHLNRALFERSAFMTMVVTGPTGFRSAMNQFAQIQNQTAPIEPDLSKPPWKWFGEYKPNRERLRQWARIFMGQCESKTCGTLKVKQGSKPWRINLKNAYLGRAYLADANLLNANLGYTYLGYANLRGAYLGGANLGWPICRAPT